MAKYEVETTTGSVYYIDTDKKQWAKNSYHFEYLRIIAVGDWDGTRTNVPDFRSWPEAELPEVGRNMYIQGRGRHNWYLTTPIVETREVEEWAALR